MNCDLGTLDTAPSEGTAWFDIPEAKACIGLLVTAIFALDTWSGVALDLAPFYALVVIASCHSSSSVLTVATVVGSAVLSASSDYILLLMSGDAVRRSSAAWVPLWNGFARLVVLAAVGVAVRALRETLDSLRSTVSRLRSTVAELESARVQIKTLEGMLPVCAWCGKMRDLDAPDRWLSLDAYMREKTTVSVTHGICPDCARRLEDEIRADS